MPHPFTREPLLPEEAALPAQACQTVREKRVIGTLLETGLRVAALTHVKKDHIDWQSHHDEHRDLCLSHQRKSCTSMRTPR